MVSGGEISEEEYMGKLEGFVARMTNGVKGLSNQYGLKQYFDEVSVYYKSKK